MAVVVFWLRSYIRHDIWSVEERQASGPFWKLRRSEVHSVGGWIVLSEVDERHLPMLPTQPTRTSTLRSMMDDRLPWSGVTRTGVRWRSGRDFTPPPTYGTQSQWSGGVATSRIDRTRLRVHHGVVALVLALPSLAWLGMRAVRAQIHHRRARAGLCPRCGYDLRATPGRCPECGEPAAPARVG